MHSWCPCTGSLSTRFVIGTSKVLYLHRFFTVVLIFISKLFSVCLWQKINCILHSRHHTQSPSKTSLLLILFLLSSKFVISFELLCFNLHLVFLWPCQSFLFFLFFPKMLTKLVGFTLEKKFNFFSISFVENKFKKINNGHYMLLK
jgi:hypothetical protein